MNDQAASVAIPSVTKPTVATFKLFAQRGFTLLEVLVSFTLISVIMATMYSGMRIVYRASDKGENQVNATSQLRTVQSFLRRQLSAALPIKFDTEFDQSAVVFRGEAQKVEFVATMPGHLQGGGIYKQTIEFVEGYEQSALEFRFEPVNLPKDGLVDKPEPVILLSAKDVRFYYWSDPDEDNADIKNWDWREKWEEGQRIPALIRIEADFDAEVESVQAFWPSLIIAPIRYRQNP